MASGVRVTDEVKKEYENLKIKKQYKYLIIALSENLEQIEVLKRGEKGEDAWENFIRDLQEAESKRENRYAVYDFEYQTTQGSSNSKLILFTWNSKSATIKQKMLYASSKDALKRCLASGYSLDKEIDDMADLDIDDITKELQKK